ncbi:hypothetical protein ACFVGM_11620 [Kitasatospora purpeofusca]|uniref:hypothetical protein n=1 Tax=Kitasatospora purpeofusca TaxID=67352 RepID=UPI0036A0967E
MSAFEREQAHRTSEKLSHLKDEVDEKNTEHVEQAREDEPDGSDSGHDPERTSRTRAKGAEVR